MWLYGIVTGCLILNAGVSLYRKIDALSHFHFNETRRKALVPTQTLFPELDLMAFWFWQINSFLMTLKTRERSRCVAHVGMFLPFWQADMHTPPPSLHLKGSSAVSWLSLLMQSIMHAYHNETFSIWLCLVHMTLLWAWSRGGFLSSLTQRIGDVCPNTLMLHPQRKKVAIPLWDGVSNPQQQRQTMPAVNRVRIGHTKY